MTLIVFGVAVETKLEGIDLELVGEFVHRTLDGRSAGCLAGRAMEGGDAEVHVDELVTGEVGFRVVEVAGLVSGRLQKILHQRRVQDHVMPEAGELALRRGGQLNVLRGLGPGPYIAEHLVALESYLDRPLDHLRRHCRQRYMGPLRALGAEAAARIRALQMDVLNRNGKRAGDDLLASGDVLRGIVEVQFLALPPRDGGVGLHGVGVMNGCGIGHIDLCACLCHGRVQVSAFLFRRLPAALLRATRFAETHLELELGRCRLIANLQQGGGVPGLVEAFSNDVRHRLVAVIDTIILEESDMPAGGWLRNRRGYARSVLERHHGKDARCVLGGGAVDGKQGPACDGASDRVSIGHLLAGNGELGRILRLSGHLHHRVIAMGQLFRRKGMRLIDRRGLLLRGRLHRRLCR